MSDSIRRVRVPAGREGDKSFATKDSFQNVAASLGYGTPNIASGGTYGFHPVSRIKTLLEWAYRGSWIVRQVVDAVADDMTRAGITIESDMPPDDMDSLHQYMNGLMIWPKLNETLKWARLYGGALAVIMIQGQNPATPLRADTVGEGQFKGLLVLDRWMVWPHLEDQVETLGPHFGLPKYYEVVADARSIPHMKIHYSRVLRFDGVQLPFWQAISENMWGISVLEPLWDRLLAFDSVTQGAAQLVYRAHLRTLKIEKLRELIAFGGAAYQAVLQQIALTRLMQSNEGMTILDSTDDFEAHSYSFAGLSDMMGQFAQQLSGASRIPLTRLFGQAPAGLNATGDSDMRNYYDAVKADQESRLRLGFNSVLDVSHRSRFGRPLPTGFNYGFNPLWQMTDAEKASTGATVGGAVEQLFTSGIIGRKTALKELRQAAHTTGMWSNITDEDIDAAEEEPPPAPGAQQEDMQAGAQAHEAGMQEGAQQHEAAMTQQQQEHASTEADKQRHHEVTSATRAKVMELIGKKAQIKHEEKSQTAEQQHGLKTQKLKQSGEAALAAFKAAAGKANSNASFHSKAEVAAHYPVKAGRGRLRLQAAGDRATITKDELSMLDYQGIPVVVETQRGGRRLGYGWTTNEFPAAYGYIQGTGSEEGSNEQMDCFVGPEQDSKKVWVIEQQNPITGKFDEHKCCLGFATKEDATNCYVSAYSDGSGFDRIGRVISMDIDMLKDWLKKWPYSTGDDGASSKSS